MSCSKKWIDKKKIPFSIQFKSVSYPISKEQRLIVPEQDEEKDFIYVVNDWK